MKGALIVEPDGKFIDGLIKGGGGDVKKCFQCATCSSVCALSTEDRTFPRRQIARAQWGMKDQLVADPAVWLCHNCGDCTARCPRGARPGDVIAAVRREVIKGVAFPRVMGNILANPAGVWVLLVLSLLVLTPVAVLPVRPDASHSLEFAYLFPQARLEILFFTVCGLVTLALAVGAVRLVRALRAAGADSPLLPSLFPTLVEIVTHRRFGLCGEHRERLAGHLLVLVGFVGLAGVGTVVGMGSLVGLMHTPLPLLHPLKISANIFAAVILVGAVTLLAGRVADSDLRRSSTYFDWFFPLTLAMVVITGILSELLRLRQSEEWMFTIYFVHLVLILALLLSAPYSKFAHFLYRTIAMAATWQEREKSTPDRLLPAAGAAHDS